MKFENIGLESISFYISENCERCTGSDVIKKGFLTFPEILNTVQTL